MTKVFVEQPLASPGYAKHVLCVRFFIGKFDIWNSRSFGVALSVFLLG